MEKPYFEAYNPLLSPVRELLIIRGVYKPKPKSGGPMSTAYVTKRKTIKSGSLSSSAIGEKPFLSSDDFRHEIKKRASEIYQNRNGASGDGLSDWLQAEKEIMRKYGVC
jgi:hypothetical protein